MIITIEAGELEIGDEIMLPMKVFNVRREGNKMVIYLEKPTEIIKHAFEKEKVEMAAGRIIIVRGRRWPR